MVLYLDSAIILGVKFLTLRIIHDRDITKMNCIAPIL